jgi:hypothetical protein
MTPFHETRSVRDQRLGDHDSVVTTLKRERATRRRVSQGQGPVTAKATFENTHFVIKVSTPAPGNACLPDTLGARTSPN